MGHGEKGTGNWCFKDGTISFQEIFNLYRKFSAGRLLSLISDCCYSGHWVRMCKDTRQSQNSSMWTQGQGKWSTRQSLCILSTR